MIYFNASSNEGARKYISELSAQDYNDGDKVEVTYPDGKKQVYVFRSGWIKEENKEYIIRP